MSKNEILELIIKYELMESERDAVNVSYAMNEDELADFAGFLLLGDWSRNITVLDEEMQNDAEIKQLFEHIEKHCEK